MIKIIGESVIYLGAKSKYIGVDMTILFTYGSKYIVLDENEDSYWIKDDIGGKYFYDKKYFLTVQEYRNMLINDILI